MSSAVDISNQALVMLGALPIVSFDDGTVEANTLKTIYEPVKSQLLRSYPWRCATRTAPLALLADAPVNQFWQFAFSWPDDAIRILNIIENTYPYNKAAKYESQERTVLAKVDSVVAEYIADIDEPQMDAHVEMALAAQLAMDMSYTIVGSNTRESNLVGLYDRKLNEAKTTDRQEASHKTFQIDTLVRDR